MNLLFLLLLAGGAVWAQSETEPPELGEPPRPEDWSLRKVAAAKPSSAVDRLEAKLAVLTEGDEYYANLLAWWAKLAESLNEGKGPRQKAVDDLLNIVRSHRSLRGNHVNALSQFLAHLKGERALTQVEAEVRQLAGEAITLDLDRPITSFRQTELEELILHLRSTQQRLESVHKTLDLQQSRRERVEKTYRGLRTAAERLAGSVDDLLATIGEAQLALLTGTPFEESAQANVRLVRLELDDMARMDAHLLILTEESKERWLRLDQTIVSLLEKQKTALDERIETIRKKLRTAREIKPLNEMIRSFLQKELRRATERAESDLYYQERREERVEKKFQETKTAYERAKAELAALQGRLAEAPEEEKKEIRTQIALQEIQVFKKAGWLAAARYRLELVKKRRDLARERQVLARTVADAEFALLDVAPRALEDREATSDEARRVRETVEASLSYVEGQLALRTGESEEVDKALVALRTKTKTWQDKAEALRTDRETPQASLLLREINTGLGIYRTAENELRNLGKYVNLQRTQHLRPIQVRLERIAGELDHYIIEAETRITTESFREFGQSILLLGEQFVEFFAHLDENLRSLAEYIRNYRLFVTLVALIVGLGLALGLLLRRGLRFKLEEILDDLDSQAAAFPTFHLQLLFFAHYLLRYVVLSGIVGYSIYLVAAVTNTLGGWVTTLLILILAWTVFRFCQGVNNMLFRRRRLRALIDLDEQTASYVHRWNNRVLFFIVGMGTILLIAQDQGASKVNMTFLSAILYLGLFVSFLIFIQRWRKEIIDLVRLDVAPDDDPAYGFLDWLKSIYNRILRYLYALFLIHIAFMVGIAIAGYTDLALTIFKATAQTLGAIFGGLALYSISKLFFGYLVEKRIVRHGDRLTTLTTILTILLVTFQQLFTLVIVFSVGLSTAYFWGFNIGPVTRFLTSDGFLDALTRCGYVIAIALGAHYVHRMLTYAIDTFTAALSVTDSKLFLRRRDTIAPLAKNAVMYMTVIAGFGGALAALGVDAKTLFAGAGVLSLALAFGAQSLVKDIITGIFLILEDGISVGDVVTVGGRTGVVEEMGIRVTKLREASGVLHVVPNGEISSLANFNRGWNRARVVVGVSYDTDVDYALEILEEVVMEYANEKSQIVLERPVVQGVLDFGASEVTLRAQMKVAPLMVWSAERELRRRIKKAFEEHEIDIPFPHQVVIHKNAPTDPPRLPEEKPS